MSLKTNKSIFLAKLEEKVGLNQPEKISKIHNKLCHQVSQQNILIQTLDYEHKDST